MAKAAQDKPSQEPRSDSDVTAMARQIYIKLCQLPAAAQKEPAHMADQAFAFAEAFEQAAAKRNA